MSEEFKSNVIFLPTVVSRENREVLSEEVTLEQAKEMAVDKIVEISETSNSIFAICIDEKTGTPSIVFGGFNDPSYVNMCLDLIKDEIKEIFKSSNAQFFGADE